MLMMLVHSVQVKAGAGANDAHDARALIATQGWRGANDAHDARPLDATQGWGWC